MKDTRTPTTETETIFMVRKFTNGKWNCDVGEYFDTEDAKEAIANMPKGDGVELIPIKQIITTVTVFLE